MPYPDLADLQGTDYMDAAIEATGAVVMGRRTFEMGDRDSYVGNYEFQVPIFVVTHDPRAVRSAYGSRSWKSARSAPERASASAS